MVCWRLNPAGEAPKQLPLHYRADRGQVLTRSCEARRMHFLEVGLEPRLTALSNVSSCCRSCERGYIVGRFKL